MISARQIRAARALLGWSQQTLADRALVSRSSVARLEEDDCEFDQKAGRAKLVQRALEDAGIHFLYDEKNGKVGALITVKKRKK